MSVVASQSADKDVCHVVLLIMQVRVCVRGLFANVFFDNGSSSNFIREAFAKLCGFRGTEEELSVTTLGGVTTDLVVMKYSCTLLSVEGQLEVFEAYGMETITGGLSRINPSLITRLFPHLSRRQLQSLQRGDNVDVLIGVARASWHPERVEKAKGEGDFWLYRGKFGSCLGGSYPGIEERTRKSDKLFHVNQKYHVGFSSCSPIKSHELEFCSRRVESYHIQRGAVAEVAEVVDPIAESSRIVEIEISDVEPVSSMVVADPSCMKTVADPSSMVVADPSSMVVADPSSMVDADPSSMVVAEPSCMKTVVDTSSMVVADPSGMVDGADASSIVADPSSMVVVAEPSFMRSRAAVETSKIASVADPLVAVSSQTVKRVPVTVSSYVEETNKAENLHVFANPWIPGERWCSVESTTFAVPAGASSHSQGAHAFYGEKVAVMFDEKLFFESESLGVVVDPRCGGCKCGNCPIVGSRFSFKEQREFDIINKNLFRKDGAWFTEYPWCCSRSVLPRNFKSARQSLLNLERTLSKDKELADDFCRQIDEMVARGAAIILTEEDLASWNGDYHYLPMVGVKGRKKWLRVCFDAARKQGGFPSFNSCLLKGPDRFLNNLLSVIVGFRNGRVGAAADISKFHNRVRLIEKDIHMQRFLWRGMNKDVEPQTYAVAVNNFGVKPANCIATCALHQSADIFAKKYPVESAELKNQTYVDDELVAACDMETLKVKTQRMDEILNHADMPNKGWLFSGAVGDSGVTIGGGDEVSSEKVLGMLWTASTDMFGFHVVLKFREGSAEVLISSVQDFDRIVLSLVLTCRLLLANVARIFDPPGLVCPVILMAKLLMRETWCGKVLKWDDPIPDEMVEKWVVFLRSLLRLAEVKFPRSLWPEEETVGLPSLVIFSDGAALAFGAAAYIRWELKKGGFWSRLIMAKCRIAPKQIESVPRMELCGAVTGTRVKNFVTKETSLKFKKVYHLVDSSTVLGYVQKESGHLRPYEGVRVAEIQSSCTVVDGRPDGVAWVSTDLNPADWCTKPRNVEDLESGFWQDGPDFLREDESSWPIRHTYKKELEGEIPASKRKVFTVQVSPSDSVKELVSRCSSWRKLVRVVARMLRWLCKEMLGCPILRIEEIHAAKKKLIRFAQKDLVVELKKAIEGKGRFRKLAPMLDSEGIFRVGSRLVHFVPFTFDGKLPAILPPDSRITLLIMEEAHKFAHTGIDRTLSRFRSQGFWTVGGARVAKKVKNACVPCRKVDPKVLCQPMGEFPEDILQNPVAWGCCQLDMLGPFDCRGDVNPRTTKKTWGILIEDVNSGAVKLDVVEDYSAEAVMKSLRRFGSDYGWPGVVYTDPGSQLESARGKLEGWWNSMERELREFGTSKNFKWKVSPPDSPCGQGKVERRIAIIKRLLRHSIGDTRLSPVELQSVFMETANICNEPPIGLSRPPDGLALIWHPIFL